MFEIIKTITLEDHKYDCQPFSLHTCLSSNQRRSFVRYFNGSDKTLFT